MPDKYFSVDGIATFVLHRGPTTLPGAAPQADRGHVVACLHDAGGNAAEFGALLDHLASEHTPFAFDQPAHGRSGALDALGSVEALAAFSLRLFEVMALPRVVLVGHGLGAAIALCCALRAPERVAGLVLCAGAARFDVSDEKLEATRLVTEGKAPRAFDRSLYAASTAPDVMRRGFMESVKTDPRATLGDLKACRDWDAESALAGISAPTRVIVGSEEAEPLRRQAELLTGRIPGARRSQISKAAHALLLEQPDAVAAAVDELLAEVGS